jgi:hypothetical protein
MDYAQAGMESAKNGSSYSKALVVGIALVTVGGVVGACGIGVSSAAIIRGVRAWLQAQQRRIGASVDQQAVPAKAASSVRGASRRKEMATSSVDQ